MSASIPRPSHADLLAVTLDRARRIVERAQAEGERLSIGEALGFTPADVTLLAGYAAFFRREGLAHPNLVELDALAAKLAAILPAEGT